MIETNTNKQLEDSFTIFKKAIGKLGEDQKCIYTDGLVLWLGVHQELECVSCTGSIDEIYSKRAFELYGECKRKYTTKMSNESGALFKARQKINLETLQDVIFSSYKHIRRNYL